MKLTITPKRKNEYVANYRYRQIDEVSGECVSTALITIRSSRYAGEFIPTMAIADVSTLPEYRNRGLVREMLETAHAKAKEYGAYVALLHPFSFDFYRKFGYEKISDTVKISFPISILASFPNADLVTMKEKHYDNVLSLFRAFSKNRNLMFDRYNISAFLRQKAETHLYYRGEKLCGYIIIEKNEEQRKLLVSEAVFTDPDALTALLSQLKTYGEAFKIAEIADAEPIPEIYSLLEGCSATYETRGDLAARILDTEALLSANQYPSEHGEFTLRVKDTLPTAAGIFKVAYENGKATVERLSEDAPADVSADASVLIRRLYGSAEITEGITLHNHAEDFLRAFPKRICGLFEHF